MKFWKIILWGSQWGRLIGHNLTPFGLPTYLYLRWHQKQKRNELNITTAKYWNASTFDIKYLFCGGGGLFWLKLKNFCEIKNVNPNVKVIHFFVSKENQINFACQHCSLSFFFTSFMAPYWPLFFLTNIEGWMPSRFFEEKICQKTMPYECVRNCNYFPCERKIMIMIQFFFCFPDLLI